jgi:probable DNA repair protein
LSPQQVDLLNAMELIATVTTLELTPSASTACRVACESVSDEIITAAGWIGALLTEDPGAKIGVVVPALEHYKADIQRSFDHLLCPQLGLGDSSGERPYNLSLGQPLGETSVIAVAMALLEFSCHELPLCKISAALRSAYIGESAVEGVQRSEVDRLLRRAGEALADPIWVLYHIGSDAPAGDVGDREREVCPHLGKRLRQWNSTRLEAARIGKPSHWARHFCALLTDMGWPGERTLDSAEYQAVEAWKEVLAQFSSLDLMLPEVTRATALHHLGRLAHDTLFQPESVAESVQIVGALEAVALDVDHLWVMGMHDQAWPIASTPNPFLSRAEQREAGVPGASPEANLRYSQQLTQQLLRLADEVIISYPTRVDHDEVEVSPLLGSLPEKSPSQISRAPLSDYASVIYAHAGLERVSSDPGPALAGQPVRGGSGVFKAQSACPFRGFAEFRLNAQAPDRLSQGLDPAERGQLLHRVMERVWQNIKSHAALLSLADDSLRQVIDDAVSASVEEAARYKPKTLRGEFQALERSRLSTLVERWMQIERDRAPFTVESTEAKHHLSIAGLEVDCRVDRVDVLDDGQRVLIDYKTGNVAPGDWFGERPFDPQLPLYALLYPERLVALSFARLQPQDIRFQGVSNDALVLPGIKAFASTREGKAVGDWSIQLQAWQASLETLAQEFCAGNAEVVPQHSKSCDHCPLPGLCRIDEMSMLDGESA